MLYYLHVRVMVYCRRVLALAYLMLELLRMAMTIPMETRPATARRCAEEKVPSGPIVSSQFDCKEERPRAPDA